MKKILIILAIFIMNSLGFINSVYATTIDLADLYSIGDCGQLLKYKGGLVKADYVQYSNNGKDYPAYCLERNKPGVGAQGYTVSIQENIKDVGLWRIIINGYPYKTVEELGVANKEEAFVATKQAVYCYLYGNKLTDYEGIGEAGQRTLNAMKMIINNANNSTETKLSSTIQINKAENEWKQDGIEKQYVSKIFYITASGCIDRYKVNIIEENGKKVEGIKITDIENKETNEFDGQQKFKVLVPIKNMTETGYFKIKVEGEVQTKPILYGIAPDNQYQDYALVAETYEDGIGEKSDEYPENETKIIILKKDLETKELLENTEFELLNENKEVIYSDLKTDSEGRIEITHLIPGKYYLRETKAKEGYEQCNELAEIQISLHEQYTITVNNTKEEQPKIEIEHKIKSKEVSQVEKLPVTGM